MQQKSNELSNKKETNKMCCSYHKTVMNFKICLLQSFTFKINFLSFLEHTQKNISRTFSSELTRLFCIDCPGLGWEGVMNVSGRAFFTFCRSRAPALSNPSFSRTPNLNICFCDSLKNMSTLPKITYSHRQA